MNREIFYMALRKRSTSLFGTSLSQKQVEGMENLLNVQEKYIPDMPIDELAYNLGTAYWETGRTMQPVLERGDPAYFAKYEPGTRLGKMLGNTIAGDGARYKGAGHVQNTGRRNARVSSDHLNSQFKLGVNFVAFPDQRLNPEYSALCLFVGNRQGWWTGKKVDDFLDHVNESTEEDMREFIRARYIVNGTDKAETIAGYAMEFRKALQEAGYGANAPTPTPPVIDAVPMAAEKPRTFVQWIVDLLKGLFK